MPTGCGLVRLTSEGQAQADSNTRHGRRLAATAQHQGEAYAYYVRIAYQCQLNLPLRTEGNNTRNFDAASFVTSTRVSCR